MSELDENFSVQNLPGYLAEAPLDRLLDEADDIWELIFTVSRLDEIAAQTVATLEPATTAKYAFTLAQRFNLFYHRYKIISEQDPEPKVVLPVGCEYRPAGAGQDARHDGDTGTAEDVGEILKLDECRHLKFETRNSQNWTHYRADWHSPIRDFVRFEILRVQWIFVQFQIFGPLPHLRTTSSSSSNRWIKNIRRRRLETLRGIAPRHSACPDSGVPSRQHIDSGVADHPGLLPLAASYPVRI